MAYQNYKLLEHAVQVAATPLYEAAVPALTEFRRCGFAETVLGLGTRLAVKVRAPETEHAISVSKLIAWLDSGSKSPNELVTKQRRKAMLGNNPYTTRHYT